MAENENNKSFPVNPQQFEQPRFALTAVANQKLWQWTNNNDF